MKYDYVTSDNHHSRKLIEEGLINPITYCKSNYFSVIAELPLWEFSINPILIRHLTPSNVFGMCFFSSINYYRKNWRVRMRGHVTPSSVLRDVLSFIIKKSQSCFKFVFFPYWLKICQSHKYTLRVISRVSSKAVLDDSYQQSPESSRMQLQFCTLQNSRCSWKGIWSS